MSGKKIKPDWRIVKVSWKSHCAEEWVKEKKIKDCGIFYLIDFNLHVHICSFTPNLEAWPMSAYATFRTPEAAEADEGEVELEMMNSEEACSYFGTEVARLPSRRATKYIDIPEQEEGEDHSVWRVRVAEHAREHFCGNPVWF